MEARVDFAITPPGLIRSAHCHTLIADLEGLAIVRVCRGWRIGFNPRGAINKVVVNKVVQRMQATAKAATATVTEATYRARTRDKGSTWLPWSDITAVEFAADRLDLRLRGPAAAYRFQFESTEHAAATTFATVLDARTRR